jgi:hypothetical protein
MNLVVHQTSNWGGWPRWPGQIRVIGFTAQVDRTCLSLAVSANDLGFFLWQFSGNHPISFFTRLNKSFERADHCRSTRSREASYLERWSGARKNA